MTTSERGKTASSARANTRAPGKSGAQFQQPRNTLSASAQFARVSAIIAAALSSVRRATEAHETARIQLEVVEFSFDRILGEVAAVMAVPAEVAARMQPVPVVVALNRVA